MKKHLAAIMSEYHQNIDTYHKLANDVSAIIQTLLNTNQIKISNMAIRIKSEEAVLFFKNTGHHLRNF